MTAHQQRVVRRFRRTIVTAAASLAVALVPSTITSVVAAGAARADGTGFRNGRASADAQVLGVAPGVGSLQIGVATGRSVAQLTNDLAQAQAQSLDLGLIGTSLTAEQCDGSPGPVKPDQLPQPTTVDNRHGDATASVDEFPLAGSSLGGGRQSAEATKAPSSSASVQALAASIGPLATVSGARSVASTRIVDAKAREAEATVSLDLDIAGIVSLHGLEWRAFHRTGADPATSGTFTVSTASAGGVPLPVDQLGSLQDALNGLLAPSGITVRLPTAQHLTSPNDLVRITPLTITLKDSPAGKAALGPVLNLTHTQREQLFDALVGAYCPIANELLVGDITLSVASGTGFMIVSVGGAEATSADLVTGNPFGAIQPFDAPGQTASPAPLPATPAALAAPGATTAASRPAVSTGPLAAICETLHPSRHPGCSRGVGVPLAVAGLVATTAIAYLDWRRQRRLTRPEPAT